MPDPSPPIPDSYTCTLRMTLEHFADPQTGDTLWVAHCGPFTAIAGDMLGALEGLAVVAPQVRAGLEPTRPENLSHGTN